MTRKEYENLKPGSALRVKLGYMNVGMRATFVEFADDGKMVVDFCGKRVTRSYKMFTLV